MEMAAAIDNCSSVSVSVEEVSTAGACAGDYVITRTFTATDGCGNSTSATQAITIIDTTAPVFTWVQLTTQQSVLTNTQWKKLLLLTTVEKWLSL